MKANLSRLLIPACAVALLLIIIFTYFNPERRLARSWNGFIAAIESRSARATADYLAENYTDNWGYTQPTLSKDLWRIYHSFSEIEITLSDEQIAREGGDATITAKVQLRANGNAYAGDAIRQVNGLTEPFVVTWKQGASFPWAWRIVRIEQKQFDATRYPRNKGYF